MIALIGYYLASPFNFLLFLFPPEKIQLFVFLVTGLKIGLCGLTFSIFLQKRFEKIPATAILLLSSAYAFTQYNNSINIPFKGTMVRKLYYNTFSDHMQLDVYT